MVSIHSFLTVYINYFSNHCECKWSKFNAPIQIYCQSGSENMTQLDVVLQKSSLEIKAHRDE